MISSTMTKRSGLLILVSFVLLSTSRLYAADQPWQSRKTTDGIDVYTRKVEGSAILEFKGTITINSPLSKIIPIVLHLPWPVTERDSVFRLNRSTDEKNSSITYSIHALPDYLPARPSKIRVLMVNAIWRFTPLPDGKTEIYFQQHTDPGGSIPAFLVNSMAVDTPYNSLKNLGQLITESH